MSLWTTPATGPSPFDGAQLIEEPTDAQVEATRQAFLAARERVRHLVDLERAGGNTGEILSLVLR